MSLFSFPVKRGMKSYNTKWTLLSFIRYVVTDHDFHNYFSSPLSDKNFFDAIQDIYNVYPAFAVEYMGIREAGGGYPVDSYLFSYRGERNQPIINIEGVGQITTNLQLCNLHDSIIRNIRESSVDGIPLWDFSVHNEPSETGHFFKADITESAFETQPNTLNRVNGFDLVIEVSLEIFQRS